MMVEFEGSHPNRLQRQRKDLFWALLSPWRRLLPGLFPGQVGERICRVSYGGESYLLARYAVGRIQRAG